MFKVQVIGAGMCTKVSIGYREGH